MESCWVNFFCHLTLFRSFIILKIIVNSICWNGQVVRDWLISLIYCALALTWSSSVILWVKKVREKSLLVTIIHGCTLQFFSTVYTFLIKIQQYAEFSKMKIGQRKCEIKFVIYLRVRVRACACACVCVRQCCGAGDSRAFGSAPTFWGKNNCSIIDLRNKFKHMAQTH